MRWGATKGSYKDLRAQSAAPFNLSTYLSLLLRQVSPELELVMPSEPIEAEFISPPALTNAQEDEYRVLDREGPLSRHSTHTQTFVGSGTPGSPEVTVKELEADRTREGYHIVSFEKSAGEDPREWSLSRKWFVTMATSFLCLAVAMGSSIITGDMVGPSLTLHIQQEITMLTVTCFVMGFGFGPLIFAPLSELFGRKPIYCVSIFLYFIFTLPSALAKNGATLIIGRMLAGLAASAPMCNVGGTIADVWSIEQRGAPMAIFSTTIFLGPCVGPLVGGWIGMRAGWRWIYWVLFIFVGVCFIFTLIMPETLAPVLLRKKAEKLRKATGDDKYRTLEELEKKPLYESIKIALVRPLVMMFTEPIIIFMSFYLAFVYCLLYLLFFAFPIAFTEIRGWNAGMTGVSFVSIMLGSFLAIIIIPLQEKIYKRATKNGDFPEARLYLMMIAAFVLPFGLFIFAFTGAYANVHWIAPLISGVIFGFAMILLYISANSYIIDSYSSYAASAIAAKTLLRSEAGAMVPLFAEQMFHKMGFQYAGLLLALFSCVIGPIPFVFFFYGHKIRARSKKASQKQRIPDSHIIQAEKGGE